MNILHFLEAIDESESFIKALLRLNVFAQNSWSAEVKCLSLKVAFFVSFDGVNEELEAKEKKQIISKWALVKSKKKEIANEMLILPFFVWVSVLKRGKDGHLLSLPFSESISLLIFCFVILYRLSFIFI